MNFSIKSKSDFLVDKATVWDKLIDRRFISTHFPEMMKKADPITNNHTAPTRKHSGELHPSWAISGKSIAWDANAGIEFVLPSKNISIESIYINISNYGAHTEVMMELEGEIHVGIGCCKALKAANEFVNKKLTALRDAISISETYELPQAA